MTREPERDLLHPDERDALPSAAETIDRYAEFARWLDAELVQLESRYSGWGTPGYAQWRKAFGARRMA